MEKPKIILAGGSGFLGRTLAPELLSRGYDVVILTRDDNSDLAAARAVPWDGATSGAWTAELEGTKAVIGLAGKNVNCRYTVRALREINESRIRSTRALGDAIHRCSVPPLVWVQASSLAIYGDAGEVECTEDTPVGQGIPVETCLAWERAFAESPTPRTRRVLLRISFVLRRKEGALRLMEKITRCGLGGTIASGRQYVSWIHWHDMNRIFVRAIEDASFEGSFNATSPGPVPNADFMRELRRVLHRPWSPPLPSWLLPLGCWLLRTEPVLARTGRRGVPTRLLDHGFSFAFADLPAALRDIFP
ncbi:MAG: TIGR01777 family oxidoreductase [Verrucomicrobiales bacterium]